MAKTWKRLFRLSIYSAYFYIFMEWLFFATKESALSKLPGIEQGLVLFITGGLLAFIVIGFLASLLILGMAARHIKGEKYLLFSAQLIPALILSTTALILFDNFTYTIFKFGIVTSSGIWRGLYALGLLIFFVLSIRFIRKQVQKLKKNKQGHANFTAWLAFGLVSISLLAIGTTILRQREYYSGVLGVVATSQAQRPHILILGADGLSNSHLSFYEYSRETTPFLNQLASTSLLAENNFTNASSTTASTTSVLTGKAPADVDVMRYPDILKGEDAYEHLPGILKQYGYTSVEIGVSYWVDAFKVNLLDGFDIVNGQTTNPPSLRFLRQIFGNSHAPYFIWEISGRLSERVQHIFYIREMPDPMEVVKTDKKSFTDQQRFEQIIDTLEKANTPVFIFAHFMDTHGPDFAPRQQIYSQGSIEDAPWSMDFYDDAILGFDGYVEQIVTYLKENALLDETIIVIYTDHGYKYTTTSRLPLLMHFPNDEHTGRIFNNTQNLDIPVTLLDYMGIPKPEWMSGLSLLEGEPPNDRPIISIIGGSPKNVVAPFYQIKTVQMTVCNKWYQLNVQNNQWKHGTIIGHTATCTSEQHPDPAVMRHQIIQYLKEHNYDVRSLHE